MSLLRRFLCAVTRHSWMPMRVEADAALVLCKCSFCGIRRWITLSCFEKRL